MLDGDGLEEETMHPAAPTNPPRSKLWLAAIIAGAGLVVAGTVLGWVLRGDPFVTAAEAFRAEAPGATDRCCETLTVTVGRGGGTATGKEASALVGVLDALGFSDGTLDRMGSTRALDGTQTAEGELASASWTFHPDDGLRVIFEPND